MRATVAIVALGVLAALWRVGGPERPASPARATVAVQPAAISRSAPSTAPAPPTTSAPPGPARGQGPSAAALPAADHAANAASAAARLLRAQAAVQAARRQGKDEQEVHRLRVAQLPAQQAEVLARMEAAEKSWRQRVEALQAACAAGIGCEDARASFTRDELARTAAYAAPTLRR